MFRELLSLFRTNDAIARMGDDFSRMLGLARDLTTQAGRFFFEQQPTADELMAVYKRDVEINKLQRAIRKQVVIHLTLSREQRDVPYCLLLMSLVKDVERIGDYCKNLSEIHEDGGGPLPDDENAAELREIRTMVEDAFGWVGNVFANSDTATARDLIARGREVNRRCDALVVRAAGGPYDARTTTTLVLGARYYKRIGAHLLNVLTGVVMPLHKLDYFDESVLPR